MKHSHYKKDVSHLSMIDVYRVLALFEVGDQAIGHAIKKLLCAGKRGSKPKAQDVQEAIDTLVRWQAMLAEDCEVSLPDDFGQQNMILGGAMIHCPDCSKDSCPCIAK